MQRKTVMVVINRETGVVECYGSLVKLCNDKELPYHSLKMKKGSFKHGDLMIIRVPFNGESMEGLNGLLRADLSRDEMLNEILVYMGEKMNNGVIKSSDLLDTMRRVLENEKVLKGTYEALINSKMTLTAFYWEKFTELNTFTRKVK